ncbi:MAG TPA: TIGR03560 family F420-dependent LLM class oxidoreductase [Acidimicrobiales bacterium]
MRFSVWPGTGQPFADVLEVARHAADTGWDGVWVADHFMANAGGPTPPETPMLEAGSTVAALAATVPRVRLGTLVYGNTYRHPAVVANMAATVDRISDGRFTLGLGTGWQVNEHRQYGIPLPPTGELVDRFAEALQVVRSLLRQPTTTFAGRHYRLTDALCEPKPVQRPLPILVGASGERRMLRLVARWADQWNCWGGPDVVRHKSAVLDRHCAEVGRDPATIARTAQALVFLTDDVAAGEALAARVPRAAFGGPPERLAEVVAEYAEAGLDELIVPDVTLGTGSERLDRLDTFIERVAADFR